uniref:Protein FAM162B-like n=1 Tax=Dromaius novaehollandiae TaxID=8790 RepID=A0A8C4KRQ6_DRONO|nr:protein FAM162B-like [Dromaius novaehollandiae]
MLGRLLAGRAGRWWPAARLRARDPPGALPLPRFGRGFVDEARGTRDAASRTANPASPPFKNDRRPTNFDKKVLVWAGRFKREEEIPAFISSEVLDASRNSVRIKVCYIMIALTLLGCLAMVVSGKEAAKRDHTLLRMNTEKKAKWRAETERDQEAAVETPR